jgi:hypothetical protein
METVSLYRIPTPHGHLPLSEAASTYRRSLSGLRLLVARGHVTAVKIRGRVFVRTADLDRLEQPQPISPPPHAA